MFLPIQQYQNALYFQLILRLNFSQKLNFDFFIQIFIIYGLPLDFSSFQSNMIIKDLRLSLQVLVYNLEVVKAVQNKMMKTIALLFQIVHFYSIDYQTT